jgi:transcriptional regulator with XRE-family HTH domain
MTAAQFKEARKKLGVSQEALAHMLGISVRSVARYERGSHPVPKTVELALHYLVGTRRKHRG